MKKQMANIITGCRILCSGWLLLIPVFSVRFYVVYLFCGLTDMADGIIARKTNSESELGARLDSAADLIFAAAAFVKILPELVLPGWVWGWMIVILIIRAVNAAAGFIREKRLIFRHTVLNKMTGLLLFLLPLTPAFIDLKSGAAAVCVMASAAAVQEGYLIKAERNSDSPQNSKKTDL